MKANSFSWKTPDGLKIFGREWPVEAPRALLSIVHGLGEHIDRYDQVAAFYHQAGIAVVGNDHRGHGKSDGKKGHTPAFEYLLDEVAQLVEESRRRYPDIPHFLFGQSMGGNLVLNYTLNRSADFAGVIVSSPWIQLAFQPNAVKVGAARLLKSIFPAFTQPNSLDPAHLSTDPKVGEKYSADPLVHNKITAGLATAMFDAANSLHQFTGTFPCPLLVLQGTDDRIVSPRASREFAGRIQGDVSFVPWEGLFHELHNEIRRFEVLNITLDWIISKLTTKNHQ